MPNNNSVSKTIPLDKLRWNRYITLYRGIGICVDFFISIGVNQFLKNVKLIAYEIGVDGIKMLIHLSTIQIEILLFFIILKLIFNQIIGLGLRAYYHPVPG